MIHKILASPTFKVTPPTLTISVPETSDDNFKILLQAFTPKTKDILEKDSTMLDSFSLVFEGNIVAAMSFGRHPRNKKTIVLDRLCFKSNVTIVGGASKLFKACKMWGYDNDYREVITWSDNRWSEGKIYKTLGFVLQVDLGPDYSYVKFKSPIKRISKQSQKKSNTGCPKETTEKEYALKNGLARIWDCGKKRWSCNLASS